jgi:RsiW-degrading membrane proteinase PrsW (M82 family)
MYVFIIVVAFILISAWFGVSMIKRDRGEREPIGALWLALGFGTVGAVVAGYLEKWLLPPIDTFRTLGDAAMVALAVGAIEELCKSVPLIAYIYRKRYFNEHTDGVIYFALAGIGFGLPENILYTLQFGTKAGLARIILTPLFHAATTGLVGYVVIKVKLDRISKSRLIMTFVSVAVIHGLYDFGAFSGLPVFILLSVVITLALTINLFVLFTRAQHLDQQQGLSVVGHNSFCRSCGHPNPNHNLYCSQCGKRA